MKLDKARQLFENLFLPDFQTLNIKFDCFKFILENDEYLLFYNIELGNLTRPLKVKVLSDKRIYISIKSNNSEFYVRVSTHKDFKYVLVSLFSESFNLDPKLLQ